MLSEKVQDNLKNIGIKSPVGFYCQEILDAFDNIAWEEEYMGENFVPLFAPILNAQDFLNTFGFEKVEGKYPELKGKKITDIGSGFGSLPFELQDSDVKLSLVDPVFAENDANKIEALNKNILNIEKDIKSWKERIDEKSSHVKTFYNTYQYDFSNIGRRLFESELPKINKEEEIVSKIKKLNIKREKLKNDLQKWKDLLSNKPKNLELHGTIGENISTIGDNSQDYVFISCVLDKDSVQPELVLSEASRILKPNGKIYMVHVVYDIHKVFQKFLNKYNIPFVEKNGSYISVIEKKL